MKWIMGIGLPSIMVILGILILAIKPKRNSWFGYRTKQSLHDDDCWYYANKIMANLMIYINTLVCIPLICVINIFITDTVIIVLGILGLLTVSLIIIAIITQIALNNFINKNKK